MFKIGLVEDNAADAEEARLLLERFSLEEKVPFELVSYGTGCEFLDAFDETFDIVILDIDLPDCNGLNVAKRVREKYDDVVICFMSVLGNLAPEGYNVEASAFMVKPISYNTLRRSMRRMLRIVERDREFLVEIKQGKATTYVDARRILYIEARHKRTIVHTLEGEILCGDPVKSFQAKLEDYHFFRIHTAFLVNLEHVQNATASEIMVDNVWLPVSKHRKKEFMATLAAYVGRVS